MLNQLNECGMHFCLFKRECLDDEIVEKFLASHHLQANEYNVSEIREFAELSIESPIDFKELIKNLQKRAMKIKKEEAKLMKRAESIADPSNSENHLTNR